MMLLLLIFGVCFEVTLGFIPSELLGISSPSSTFHTAMSEKAIIRHAASIFSSWRDPKLPPIQADDAESLFRAFYGDAADWKGFQDAVDQITAATAGIDSDKATKKNPKWHFDSERIMDGHNNLIELADMVVKLVQAEQYDSARETLGRLMHPLQDFYSHTNWIEMGKMQINYNLGIKGKNPGKVAPPGKRSCVDCKRDLSSRFKSGLLKMSLVVPVGLLAAGGDEDNIYDCVDNVVLDDELTSGYSVNQKDDAGAPVEKPENVGKCSHGGVLDTSSGEYALGGLNKDSENGLFAAHDYLHSQAVIFAENATVYYLDHLRNLTKDDVKWSRLLQLFLGTSVTFIVDISQSMLPYVESARTKVRETILKHNENNTHPSEYIFVPFSQTIAGPTFAFNTLAEADKFTKDFVPEKYLDNSTTTQDRKMYEALMIAAIRSSVGGVMYALTNGVPSDSHMVPWLDETLRRKRITLYIRLAQNLDTLRRRRALNDNSAASVVNPRVYKDFSKLTRSTGGDIVIVDRDELEQTVEFVAAGTRKAFILLAQGETNKEFTLPIDSTVDAFEVTIFSNDNVPKMQLQDNKGKISQPQTVREGLLYGKWLVKKPEPGSWKLNLTVPRGESWLYTVAVRAVTNIQLNFDMLIREYDPDTNHPGMQVLRERPLFGGNVTLQLKSSIKQSLYPIYVQLRDPNFKIIGQFAVREGKSNIFFSDITIPEHPFYIRISGYDYNGFPFMRIDQDLIEPSNIFIDIDKPRLVDTVSHAQATPDVTKYLSEFVVWNRGFSALLTFRAFDVANFTSLYYPGSAVVRKNQYLYGQILFELPKGISGATTTVFLQANSIFEQSSNVLRSIVTFA